MEQKSDLNSPVLADDDIVARTNTIKEENKIPALRLNAHANIKKVLTKYKMHYDIKHWKSVSDVGDRVFQYNRRHGTCKGGKLNLLYWSLHPLRRR